VPPRCVIAVPSKNSHLEVDPNIMEGNPSSPTSFDWMLLPRLQIAGYIRLPSDGAPRKCCSTSRGCVLGGAWPFSVYACAFLRCARPALIFVLGLSFIMLEDFEPCLKSR
jgi:hypothetical protein